MKTLSTLLIVSVLTFTACKVNVETEGKTEMTKKTTVTYPITHKDETVHEYFGEQVADPYNWLENDTTQKTADWVSAQNEVTYGYLNQIPFRDKIKDRYTELMNYPKMSAPRKIGDYFVFYKNDGLQNQSVIYYKKGDDGSPEVLIDPNTLSAEGTASIGLLGNSKDDKYLAYSRSDAGSDWSEIRIRDIESNTDLVDRLQWVKFSGAAWYGNGFFYARYPAPSEGTELSAVNGSHSVYYHKIGDNQANDKLVYENTADAKLYHGVSLTEDEKYLVLYVYQGTEGVNIHFKEASNWDGDFKPLVEGFNSKGYVVDHVNGKLLLHTDRGASNNRLVAIDPNNVDEANWETIVAENEDLLEGSSTGGAKLFTSYLKDVTTRLYVSDLDGSNKTEITLPGAGSASSIGGKVDQTTFYYSYSSFNNPGTIYQFNLPTLTSSVYYQPELKFNPDDYVSKQVKYPSKDGTMVNLFIVHKKGLELNGTNPTLLYGYGGFNIKLTPSFSASNIILLENGGVYALANLRGGGEYGEKWHSQGMLLSKQNVFDDFIAAGEYLVQEGYTSKDHLAVEGGSNGGLLVGACINQRPDLFKVAFPAVGVMDMLRYHKFTVGWGWVPEYGSSEESEEMFQYLKGYSPLHNIKAQNYPATMVKTADHDDRVVPAHSFKYAATLQAAQTGDAPTLIRIDVNAGHGAGKPTSKIIDEISDKWAFMFYEMGIEL